MKKSTNYVTMMCAVAATLLLSACGGKTEDPKPDPKVNFKTTAGYTFANSTVAGDDIVKAGILINHEYKIKKVLFQVTVAGSTFTVKDSAMSSKVVDMDFIRQVITTPGTETWTITATDENDKTASASFVLTVTGADQDLIAYEGNSTTDIDIYRFQSSQPKSALNLDEMIIYSAANANDGVKDIYDNTAGSADLYAPVWASKSGATFVKVTGGAINYATTTKYSVIVNYFNSKTPSTTSEIISNGDMYVVKGGDKNRYHLVLVAAVNDAAGVNSDYVKVKIKTIDITK